jgi:hypothetical protein
MPLRLRRKQGCYGLERRFASISPGTRISRPVRELYVYRASASGCAGISNRVAAVEYLTPSRACWAAAGAMAASINALPQIAVRPRRSPSTDLIVQFGFAIRAALSSIIGCPPGIPAATPSPNRRLAYPSRRRIRSRIGTKLLCADNPHDRLAIAHYVLTTRGVA